MKQANFWSPRSCCLRGGRARYVIGLLILQTVLQPHVLVIGRGTLFHLDFCAKNFLVHEYYVDDLTAEMRYALYLLLIEDSRICLCKVIIRKCVCTFLYIVYCRRY